MNCHYSERREVGHKRWIFKKSNCVSYVLGNDGNSQNYAEIRHLFQERYMFGELMTWICNESHSKEFQMRQIDSYCRLAILTIPIAGNTAIYSIFVHQTANRLVENIQIECFSRYFVDIDGIACNRWMHFPIFQVSIFRTVISREPNNY